MKLTMITACFNAAKDLKKPLGSILAQTLTDFEYLIIDKRRKNYTQSLLESYKPQLSKKKIRYISESDKGIYDVMNKETRLANR